MPHRHVLIEHLASVARRSRRAPVRADVLAENAR